MKEDTDKLKTVTDPDIPEALKVLFTLIRHTEN